jgi:hypothetical protein
MKEVTTMNGKKMIGMMALATILIGYAGIAPLSPIQDVPRIVTNYPNPFDSRSGNTTILYRLFTDSAVKVKIYDLFGNMVREYPSSREDAGVYRIVWDGTNESGEKVAKGGYLCIIEVSNEAVRYVATRKIGVLH